jgi:hypothetical protein
MSVNKTNNIIELWLAGDEKEKEATILFDRLLASEADEADDKKNKEKNTDEVISVLLSSLSVTDKYLEINKFLSKYKSKVQKFHHRLIIAATDVVNVKSTNVRLLENLKNYISLSEDQPTIIFFCHRRILLYLQQTKQYGVFLLPSLQDVIDGKIETIGNFRSEDGQLMVVNNYYRHIVSNIIIYQKECDDNNYSLWNSLNKSNWTQFMRGFFYGMACDYGEKKIVDDIENLMIKFSPTGDINDLVKMYKYIKFIDILGLQKMLYEIKKEEKLVHQRMITSDFTKTLLEQLDSESFSSYSLLLDFFIDNFGLDCKYPNSSIKEKFLTIVKSRTENNYDLGLRDKEFFFHLVKRKILSEFPIIFDDYCNLLVGLTSSDDKNSSSISNEEIIKDICFLSDHGYASEKSFHTFSELRERLSNFFNNVDNLIQLFVQLDQTFPGDGRNGDKKKRLEMIEKLLSKSEVKEIKNQLHCRKILLEKYLIDELVPIILSYTF